MTRNSQNWPWWRCITTGLSAIALALSAYLSWHSVLGESMIGCGGGSPCEQVLNSRWSSVGGVLPVSGLAAGAYLAMLLASLSIGPAAAAPVRRLAWQAMLVLTGAAAGSAVWFIIVQKWIIGAFCPYCTATHIIGLLLAGLLFWKAPEEAQKSEVRISTSERNPKSMRRRSEKPFGTSHRTLGFRNSTFGIRVWTFAGVAVAGLLVVSQIVFVPAPVYRAGETQANPLPIDPQTVPLVGPSDALYVVKLLFDYKCPHCQQLHFMLDEVVRRYQGKLAFALCPTPLERACNPYVLRDVAAFTNSCELARVGLAVWLADREALRPFELWMFTMESGDRWQPRSLEAATARAIELVGRAKFDAARTNAWVDRYLQSTVKLFGDTGSNAIPKMVFGPRWVIPQPNDAGELVSILQETLGVPVPSPDGVPNP